MREICTSGTVRGGGELIPSPYLDRSRRGSGRNSWDPIHLFLTAFVESQPILQLTVPRFPWSRCPGMTSRISNLPRGSSFPRRWDEKADLLGRSTYIGLQIPTGSEGPRK